ncbi:MAG: hypothetical protein HGB08_01045 [Candidatus Moranbacteria bacterium]|nr:hypothetical protein [Candidatus Moranbacteria bacterium]
MPHFDDCFGNPIIDQDAFVSSQATIIGKIIIEKDVIVAPNVSLRADEGSPFIIRKGTNIQDGVVFHGLLGKYVRCEGEDYSIHIGSHCSIAHGAIVHGPSSVGKKTFIGFRAIVHNSSVGKHCFIDMQATVKGSLVGDFCHIGTGARLIGVNVPCNRYIEDGLIVNKQEMVKTLPCISEEQLLLDYEFNKEVVDYNKILVGRYRERRKSML